MSNEPQKDWLDDALRSDDRYIDDAGFSARVVAALPARRKRVMPRHAIIGITTVIACAVGLVILPSGKYLADGIISLLHVRSLAALQAHWAVLLVIFSLLGGSVVLATIEQ